MQGSMISGLTGMVAQDMSFGTISDNISNARTVGFKEQNVQFKTLISQKDTPANYQWGGVTPSVRQFVDKQGVLQSTTSSTDFAINGEGFFNVASAYDPLKGTFGTSSEKLLTRAGSFQIDKNGYLTNTAGYVLLGTKSIGTTGGSINNLQPVKLSTSSELAAQATSRISLRANLPAIAEDGTTSTDIQVQVFDSTGAPYAVTMSITKDATTQGVFTLSYKSVESGADSTVTGTVPTTTQTLTFDGAGKLTSPTSDVNLGTISLSNGQTLSPTISVWGSSAADPDAGALTMQGGIFTNNGTFANGSASATRVGTSLGEDGTLFEVYDNGAQKAVWQIPLSRVINPNGLEQRQGNAFAESLDSGTPYLNLAEQNGAGTTQMQSLEQSNIDLADQFSNMIVTQRAYQASSKVISTSDEMLQTVAGLKR